jgi:CRP/FNR family transcriptional regulator, cyclic AMP receptor protein
LLIAATVANQPRRRPPPAILEPSEDIVGEGSLGDALFLVLSGDVAIHRGWQTFAPLTAGDFCGEMSLVEPAPRSATVTAISATFLFQLSHDALRRLISEAPAPRRVLLVQITDGRSRI